MDLLVFLCRASSVCHVLFALAVTRVCIYNDLITPTSCLSKSFVSFLFSVHRLKISLSPSLLLLRVVFHFRRWLRFLIFSFCQIFPSVYWGVFLSASFYFAVYSISHQSTSWLWVFFYFCHFSCVHIPKWWMRNENHLNLFAMQYERSSRRSFAQRPTWKHENCELKEMENFRNI